MKRLLKISFDLALLSFIPILSWFCLSLIVDKNLINIFTLTYPIQFVWYILKSIFSTGANISKEKDKNKNATMSGIILGSIVAFLIFGFIVINIEEYISFMNMDVTIYKTFATYSVIQLFIQLVFAFVLEKLYYEEKNDIANKYSLVFNLLNFIVLIGSSLLCKNQIIIVTITLLSILIYTIYVFIKSFNKFNFKLDILKCIKYDSVELFNNIAFFFILSLIIPSFFCAYRLIPPSTTMFWPVIKDASSLIKNFTAFATSDGVPIRPRGVSSARACRSSSLYTSSIAVFITPGLTQFTRTPEGPISFAIALVKVTMPPLAAE